MTKSAPRVGAATRAGEIGRVKGKRSAKKKRGCPNGAASFFLALDAAKGGADTGAAAATVTIPPPAGGAIRSDVYVRPVIAPPLSIGIDRGGDDVIGYR